MTTTVLYCADGTAHEAKAFSAQEKKAIASKHGAILKIEKRKY